jgi:hypothetical protein
MPVLHIIASTVVIIVLVSVVRDTIRLSRGQVTASSWLYASLILVSALAAWQAAIWLTSDHPNATAMFRAGVMLQLSCALAIVAFSVVALHLARRRSAQRIVARRHGS